MKHGIVSRGLIAAHIVSGVLVAAQFLFPSSAFAAALALDKSTYNIATDSDICITSFDATTGDEFGIFDVNSDQFINGFTSSNIPPTICFRAQFGDADFFTGPPPIFAVGNYAAIRFEFDGPPDCDQVGYTACKISSDFREEFLYTIVNQPPTAGFFSVPSSTAVVTDAGVWSIAIFNALGQGGLIEILAGIIAGGLIASALYYATVSSVKDVTMRRAERTIRRTRRLLRDS